MGVDYILLCYYLSRCLYHEWVPIFCSKNTNNVFVLYHPQAVCVFGMAMLMFSITRRHFEFREYLQYYFTNRHSSFRQIPSFDQKAGQLYHVQISPSTNLRQKQTFFLIIPSIWHQIIKEKVLDETKTQHFSEKI